MLEINKLYNGDCLDILKTLPDGCVDAVITDPPAGIAFMGNKWDDFNGDLNSFQDFIYKVMSECYRVLKDGAHIVVWALPRTSHHTSMGIERAGFEIRDVIHHIFTKGFPKSFNVGKSLSKVPGGEKWDGYGTTLKPLCEHWILARKPIKESTISKQVLCNGCGAINIDGCRIPFSENDSIIAKNPHTRSKGTLAYNTNCYGKYNASSDFIDYTQIEGRFPANVVSSSISDSNFRYFNIDLWAKSNGIIFVNKITNKERDEGLEDFSYGSSSENLSSKIKNNHPTVKSLALMSWFVTLISNENGLVLDPFMGSGTTAVSCVKLKRNFIGMEKDDYFVEISKAKISYAFKSITDTKKIVQKDLF